MHKTAANLPEDVTRAGHKSPCNFATLLAFQGLLVAASLQPAWAADPSTGPSAEREPPVMEIVQVPEIGADLRCSLPAGLGTENCYSGDVIDRTLKLQSLQQDVDRLVAAEGIYHAGLVDRYLALADFFQAEGAYDRTLVHLNQALEVARANDGLYGESQIPVLERMVLVHNALENASRARDFRLLKWRIERKLHPSPPREYWSSLEYELDQAERIRQQIQQADGNAQRSDLYQQLDFHLESAIQKLASSQSTDLRMRLGIQLERVVAKVAAINSYDEQPREFFKPVTRLTGIQFLDSQTRSKRRNLRAYIDSIEPVVSDIESLAGSIPGLTDTDRGDVDELLQGVREEIEIFKGYWPQIFDQS